MADFRDIVNPIIKACIDGHHTFHIEDVGYAQYTLKWSEDIGKYVESHVLTNSGLFGFSTRTFNEDEAYELFIVAMNDGNAVARDQNYALVGAE